MVDLFGCTRSRLTVEHLVTFFQRQTILTQPPVREMTRLSSAFLSIRPTYQIALMTNTFSMLHVHISSPAPPFQVSPGKGPAPSMSLLQNWQILSSMATPSQLPHFKSCWFVFVMKKLLIMILSQLYKNVTVLTFSRKAGLGLFLWATV